MSAPSRTHQKIMPEPHITIGHYIREKNRLCKVYPAPFAVKLFEDDSKTIVEPDIIVICRHDYIRKLNLYADAGVREYWIVTPMDQSVYAYFLEGDKFRTTAYTFKDKIKVTIYDDLYIDFAAIYQQYPGRRLHQNPAQSCALVVQPTYGFT